MIIALKMATSDVMMNVSVCLSVWYKTVRGIDESKSNSTVHVRLYTSLESVSSSSSKSAFFFSCRKRNQFLFTSSRFQCLCWQCMMMRARWCTHPFCCCSVYLIVISHVIIYYCCQSLPVQSRALPTVQKGFWGRVQSILYYYYYGLPTDARVDTSGQVFCI
jgi:hypothetical protein